MSAKSEKQLKLIFAVRNKYKSKSKTPNLKLQKVEVDWGEEWTLKKESFIITNFSKFIN